MENQNLLLIQQQQESNVMFEHFLQESALECSNMPFLCFAPSYGPSTISISPFGVTTDRNLIAWVFLCWLKLILWFYCVLQTGHTVPSIKLQQFCNETFFWWTAFAKTEIDPDENNYWLKSESKCKIYICGTSCTKQRIISDLRHGSEKHLTYTVRLFYDIFLYYSNIFVLVFVICL